MKMPSIPYSTHTMGKLRPSRSQKHQATEPWALPSSRASEGLAFPGRVQRFSGRAQTGSQHTLPSHQAGSDPPSPAGVLDSYLGSGLPLGRKLHIRGPRRPAGTQHHCCYLQPQFSRVYLKFHSIPNVRMGQRSGDGAGLCGHLGALQGRLIWEKGQIFRLISYGDPLYHRARETDLGVCHLPP